MGIMLYTVSDKNGKGKNGTNGKMGKDSTLTKLGFGVEVSV